MFFLIILISCNLFSQSAQFYYSNGEKIPIVEDKNSLVIIFKETSQLQKVNLSIPAEKIEKKKMIENKKMLFIEENNFYSKSKIEVIKDMGINLSDIAFHSFVYKTMDHIELIPTNIVALKLKEGVSEKDLEAFINNKAVVEVSKTGRKKLRLYNNNENIIDLANKIYESGKVKYCHPSFIANIVKFDDPLYTDQYYLNNTGQFGGTQDIDINAPEAWQFTMGTNDIIIAIIDDGLEPHQDLKDGSNMSRIIGGYTPINGGNGTPSLSTAGHGIACAGIALASHNNLDIKGVFPNGKILGVNIFAPGTTDEEIADGIDWAWQNNADVISNSWGYNGENTYFDNIADAITTARTNGRNGNGTIVVFSAGNYGSYVAFPAKVNGVIAVGAINKSGGLWYYSSVGPAVALVAPTGDVNQMGDVRTIDRMGTNGYNSGNNMTNFGGTSAACPQVAGVAALILSYNSTLSESQVKNILTSTADDMGTAGKDNNFGYGRVNSYKSIKYLIENYSKTLNGNFTFISDLNISAGVTLTVLQNSNINFIPNASLTVNGTLSADGTSGTINFASTGASKWGGIKLQSTASANSVIKYCNIDNANQGIYIGLSNSGSSNFPTVEYNTITNCNDGIYLYNSEGSSGKPLRYNDISNSTNGIRFEGLAGYSNYVWITNNSLYNNESGLVIRYAHPRVFSNHSTCNGYGVKVENYSYPKFAGTSTSSPGYNRFADNSAANLYANNDVNVWMGELNEVDEGKYGGDNTLGSAADSQNPWAPLYIGAYNASVVMANYSYFGAYPPVSWKLERDGSSSIDYTNYRSTDPVPGTGCSQFLTQTFGKGKETNLTLSSAAETDTTKNRLGGFATKGVSQSLPSLLLYLGMHHYMMENPDSAAIVFRGIIDSYPDSTQAVFALNMLARTLYENKIDTLPDFISKFEGRYGQNVKKKSYALYEASLPLLAGSFASKNSMSEAVSTYDKIINKFAGRESAKYAIYSKIAYYINMENDKDKAAKLYNNLAIQFPTDPLLVDALILLGEDPSEMLGKVKLAESEALQKNKNQLQKSDEDNLVVKEYKLQQNYPNPFNPSTIIQYQIPENGRVKLAVYDVLGRQVQELVNEFQSSGSYKINFNINSKLASGVYYYSIRVDGADGNIFSDTRKMVVVK